MQEFIQIVAQVSDEFNLKFNKKKSAIMHIKKRHIAETENETENIENISVVQNYRYLGIDISNKGKLDEHLRKTKKRDLYLKNNMCYYVKDLNVENQLLIWSIYIRPYYLYVSSLLGTQTLTLQKKFQS